uniref:Glucosidase 2 subunit beta n=1 Tax=Takifugu rubripes TaxID=31033 RepID=A0A674N4U3_TAKRU
MSCQCILLLLLVAGAAAVEVQRPRGVSLSKRQFYEDGKPFTCLDGSKTIPFDRVNDDYCDCQDASDEPGTAACPNGNFHCTNAGFRPVFIPSSRVNDGICDCCDTTDEYNSGAICQNTCKELGYKERESLLKLAEITKEGFLLKQQLIQEAMRGAKLEEVRSGKGDLETKVEALRTVKEAAEQPEREAKERHLKAWEDQKAAIRMEKDKARMVQVFLELDEDSDGFVSLADLLSHPELDPDSDGLFTEAEAQGLLGGLDRVDTFGFESVWNNIKDKYASLPASDNDSETYPEDDVPEEEEEEEDEDDDDYEEDYKVDGLLRKPGMNLMKPRKRSGKWMIRSGKNPFQSVLSHMDMLVAYLHLLFRNIEKEISFDFGTESEFTYMYNQCYEMPTSEYVYKLCPFNRVTQKPKFGGSETSLGSWGKWAGPEDNIYSVMKYEHGTGCWQGPNRATTVSLICGTETAVTSTSEPSRCEYLMEFTTPAACPEPPSPDSLYPPVHTEL